MLGLLKILLMSKDQIDELLGLNNIDLAIKEEGRSLT